jgi:hypothetical protein
VLAREGLHPAPLASTHKEDTMGVTALRIVVGVDDSPQSIAALAWAMGQAEATGASIEAVYAFQVPLPIP